MSNGSMLAIADVGLPKTTPTGGVLRSTRSIKEYSKHFNVRLILPPACKLDADMLTYLKVNLGVKDVTHLNARVKTVLSRERLTFTYLMIPPKILGLLLKDLDKKGVSPDVIVVLNETYDCLSIGRVAKEYLNSPSLAILQLPVLYCDKRRKDQIRRAYELWYRELYGSERLGKLARELRTKLELFVAWSKFMRNVLRSYDVLIAVSKAIAIEMNEEWTNKFYILDPGVSLDTEDLELISDVKQHVREKGSYVAFGGRIDALKGFIEALYVFKEIVKTGTSLKLVVTGHVSEKLKPRVERFIKRLGLEDRVILTGILPRMERFKIVAGAKLMLYPSHVDAFPYSVLESLYLGTPVVAYDIPALRAYYSNTYGVALVEEGDVEALAIEAFNVLNMGKIDISPPRLRSWDDIMKEEVSFINKFTKRDK